MIRKDARLLMLAVGMAALAGYLDVVGFLESSGFFVSFMSGNSTRLAAGLVASPPVALIAATLIACFVLGVIAGSVAGHLAGRYRGMCIMLIVAGLLAFASIGGVAWGSLPWLALLAVAMGAENAVFERSGDAPLGLTYMTGSLVRIGDGIAGILTGRRQRGWTAFLLLWAGLLLGAVAGAIAHPLLGTLVLWPGCAAALALAFAAMRLTAGRQ